MSTIDIRKLQKILDKADIIILEYFLIKNECAMIKTLLGIESEFVLIYISKKHRFSIPPGTLNVYNLEEIEENTENDDYSKTKRLPNMEIIDHDKSINIYHDLIKKYQKNIIMEGNDEPMERKIKRQLNRIKIPFKELDYDVAIQDTKNIVINFGDENTRMFLIKNYNPSYNERSILFFINLKNFIEKVDNIQSDINIIKNQLYDILGKVTSSNIDDMSVPYLKQYAFHNILNSGITSMYKKIKQYTQNLEDYSSEYKIIRNNENKILEKYKNLIRETEGIKKISYEEEASKELEKINNRKNNYIVKIIKEIEKYHKSILYAEEITFDNLVMVKRVHLGFERLKTLAS
jgi:hypothetical protein